MNKKPTAECAIHLENILNAVAQFIQKNPDYAVHTLGKSFMKAMESLSRQAIATEIANSFQITNNLDPFPALYVILERNSANNEILMVWCRIMSQLLRSKVLHSNFTTNTAVFEKYLTLAISYIAKLPSRANIDTITVSVLLNKYNHICDYRYFLSLENCTDREMKIHIGSIYHVENSSTRTELLSSLGAQLKQVEIHDAQVLVIIRAVRDLSTMLQSEEMFMNAIDVCFKLLESDDVESLQTPLSFLSDFLEYFWGKVNSSQRNTIRDLCTIRFEQVKYDITAILNVVRVLFAPNECVRLYVSLAKQIEIDSDSSLKRPCIAKVFQALLDIAADEAISQHPELIDIALRVTQKQDNEKWKIMHDYVFKILSRPLPELQNLLSVEHVQWLKQIMFQDKLSLHFYFGVIKTLAQQDALLLLFDKEKLENYMFNEFMSKLNIRVQPCYQEYAMEALLNVYQRIFTKASNLTLNFNLVWMKDVVRYLEVCIRQHPKLIRTCIEFIVLLCETYEGSKKIANFFYYTGGRVISDFLNNEDNKNDVLFDRCLGALDHMLHRTMSHDVEMLQFQEQSAYQTITRRRVHLLSIINRY
jgi:hypothetical protein